MSKTIYYFSATGNSLQTALDIAEGLGGTEVISMTKAGMNAVCDSEVIGFVFPSFAWGPPNLAHDFIQSGCFRKDAYFFTVVTCGSSMGGSAHGEAQNGRFKEQADQFACSHFSQPLGKVL